MSPDTASPFQYTEPRRNISQIIALDGTPCEAYGSSNIDLHYAQVFSSPVGGNEVTALTSGKAYFEALVKALRSARSEVLIAGWQINWDAQIGANGLRLLDVLLDITHQPEGPRVFLMPWDDPPLIDTYADATTQVFAALGGRVGRDKRIFVYCSPSAADEDGLFFSHHQKLVVIDRQTAFIGGIDLAYGRYDDERFTLQADAEGRDGMNRYNPCIPAIGSMTAKDVDLALLTGGYDVFSGQRQQTLERIVRGGLQPVQRNDRQSLDPALQPRMPWQDLQQRIDGPAAASIAASFVLRWNIGCNGSSIPRLEAPQIARQPLPGKSGCSVQVLRSASATLRRKEAAHVSPREAEAAFPNQQGMPAGVQDDILRCMKTLIEQSQHYLYIENQFFCSAFGEQVPEQGQALSGPARQVRDGAALAVRATRLMPGDVDGPIRNALCEALAQRLHNAIITHGHTPFHVYIVLPVHPEGPLDRGATMTQIHWTMQSLVFGSGSLLARLKASLTEAGRREEDWPQYLTLLNLRNWARLGERYVTEQIYVHSKLMIVDDRYVLHGSANINDRSLLGRRDSELAVLVHDSAATYTDLDGSGREVLTLNHARATRKAVWRKLFGLEMKAVLPIGGAAPATELESVLDRPADPKTVRAIQKVAAGNSKAYEAVFDWIPRSKSIFEHRDTESPDASSIWPRWEYSSPSSGLRKVGGAQTGPMPFQAAFWHLPQFKAEMVARLKDIKGFITELPLRWTERENNNIGYHTALMVKNEPPGAIRPGSAGEEVKITRAETPPNEGSKG